MLSCHQPAPSLPAHIGFCPKFRAALLSQAPGTPHWLPLAGGPELWGETPGAQVGGVATARGALLGSGGASGTRRDQQPSWGSPSRCFAVPGGCARGCGCEKGEVKVRSERRLPPRQGGYPASTPSPAAFSGTAGGMKPGETWLCLPLLLLLLLIPNHRKPTPSHCHRTSGRQRCAPLPLSALPPHQQIRPVSFPPCSPEPFPHHLLSSDTMFHPLHPRMIPPAPAFPAEGCHPALCIRVHPSGGAAGETPPLYRSPAPSAPSGPTCAGRSRPR